MFDITKLAAEETGLLHLKNPKDGKPLYADEAKTLPVQIRIYGPASEQFAEVEARQQNRTMERAGKVAQANADGKDTPDQSKEELAKERAEDLADLTAEFINLSYPPAAGRTGKLLATAVYLDRGLGWIIPQFNRKLNNWGNFMPGSAES